MKRKGYFPILGFCLATAFVVTGCGTFDALTLRNAEAAKDTIDHHLDPALPESARKAAQEQAAAWVEYEKSKR